MTINVFCDSQDEETQRQWADCLEHPALRAAALMPDAHGGYHAPIGSVIALKDWIVPSWVGYDIGCGMCAIKTRLSKAKLGDLTELHANIHKAVPVGFGLHNRTELPFDISRNTEAIRQAFEKRKVAQQFGTLGTGNHFIEVGIGLDNLVWIVLHSGSRGFGHEVATYWMDRQKKETTNMGWYAGSLEGKIYINDMKICLNYAYQNRLEMLKLIEKLLPENAYDWDTLINRHHNHLDIAHGYYIHRKGATHAEKDMYGVIPGNMKDGSFITRGLGNEKALWSSSHGAGRTLSRTQAKELLSIEQFERDMAGIVGDVKPSTLDESPAAYKDINEVIEKQVKEEILVVVDQVKPLLNVKG